MVERITIKMTRKFTALAIIMLFAIVPACTAVSAQTLDAKAEDNVFHFITDVMGIDTTKYEITHHSCSVSYPSRYGGSVKEELTTLVLNSSDGSSIKANVQFDNGYVYNAIFSLYGPISRDQAYNVSALEKAQNVLSRYQNFSYRLGIYRDEVPSALMMLSSVTELSTSSVINGNMKMQLKRAEPNSEIRLDYNIDFKFVYTDNGVDSPWKCLGVGFTCVYGDTKFVFADTWGLFSAYSMDLPCLSESDARAIAWGAAENYQIALLNTEDNSTVSVKPKWPVTPTVESDMDMVAGQLYNDSLLFDMSMGSSHRDGLTLYPLWKFLFYFDQPIGGMQGIQVGVWGDTTEIAYCGTYGHFGAPDASLSSEPVASQPPIAASMPLIAASALAISTIAITAAIVLRKSKANR